MRHVFLVALFACIASPLAHAQDSAPKSAAADRVQLLEDDENGVLRIVIDGKEVGRIDGGGLHIQGNVNYSGMLADVGSAEARAGGAAAAGDAD